ncbi:MAG: Y-family DNA polymerase [Candidatus Saccharimonadales bacterium]
MSAVFALIDCNNFFVSCERIFRPDLEGKPVVVLSSNDGCAIARSNEAKALGIPMGAPAFQYRQLFREHGVVQFSANFDLYGDVSQRMTTILTSVTPRTEVYSVDESFLDLSELNLDNFQAWGEDIRTRIWREVGLPVSIGIAPTKTLAKLGAERAKKDAARAGVLDFMDLTPQATAGELAATDISDIWGIGRQLAPKLRAEQIHNALDLANMRPQHARQLMGIHGRQLVAELNGVSCHPLAAIGKPRQSIMHGRTFGEDTDILAVVEASVASLTTRAAFRLRREGLLTRRAYLVLETSRFKPDYQRQTAELHFDTPTADSGQLISQLGEQLRQLYRPGVLYHRANVLFIDLVGIDRLQTDLLGYVDVTAASDGQARMRAFDYLNRRYGKDTVRYAAEDLSKSWEPKHQLRSPRYTSQWSELPIARILDR